MSQALKHFFIPHAGNNYIPHILHTKRAVFYGLVFLTLKSIVFIFTLLLPTAAFFSPEIVAAEQTKIIRLTNAFRAQKGLGRLTEVSPLENSARLRAIDMASYQYFDHEGPYHRPLDYFMAQAGYDYQIAGENLSMGLFVAEDVFRAWKNSPTHYANLIDPDYADIGFGIQAGVYQGQTVAYAALHFGNQGAAPKIGLNTTTIASADIATTTAPTIVRLPITPVLKYHQAREVFSSSMLIFPIFQAILFAALIIFTVALFLFVFIEIRRQHYHIIVQTLSIIGLLATLIVV